MFKSRVCDIYRSLSGLRRLHLNIRVVRIKHRDLQEIEVRDCQQIVDGQHDTALVDRIRGGWSADSAAVRSGGKDKLVKIWKN